MASATAPLGHFWKAQVGQFWRAPTPKYGFHMSEQTNSIFADTSGPIMVTNSLKVFTVRSLPFHKRPGTAQIDLIHQGQIFVPFAALNLVSTPMARTGPRTRCSSPQVTRYSTASWTLSQEVRNSSALSFQESLRAQCPRKCM